MGSRQIPQEYGPRLLKLVRDTIGQHLGVIDKVDQAGLEGEPLRQELATFVTLKIEGRLRGCIGNLEPAGPLLGTLAQNGHHAAFNDHRFSPLSVEEFERVQIDVSILSKPVPLDYTDGQDLLTKLRPDIDGVILEKGKARATFLPQVWKQLPEPKQFMEHLCRKAGLSPRAWQGKDIEIYLYQVQSFNEETHGVDSPPQAG
ncbi:MAG: AmmeMemoRadiSam system protein A [Desulfofustis sp.]|nr:AmmeMemoRadiSam system protein A [Desulfofustis sp.]RZW26409.1 MAG: AmmeMemoRadiSam system protein A [Desulfobulbaceae bacterium]MBT8347065.1 AmmeMemoRadiSam system protein A [Desulfofustis sp.]MBT8355519.1 AmmeMemoRadiSam system protein A [Desulfofustis sp.]NNF45132.1 AmmeMemoRadiSam system protein A [Desulfofustis sp.]